MIEVVSLDLEGTLIDLRFSELVWNEGIPKLYSEQRGIDFLEAKRVVLNEYRKIGERRREWYDIKFWFKRFGLKGDWRNLMEMYRSELKVYPEVCEVLDSLKRRYRLALLSNSAREFIEFTLEVIGNPFEKVFSASSDFNTLKKSTDFYREACKTLKVSPQQMAHVGDHYEFDFLVPKRLGILSFYLDRSGNSSGRWVVKDLREFNSRILEMDRR
ncbi:haloacid dehalogenase [Candidatus Bathyarchaeota archaeon B24-2]|nr:MAG: haloacid dehalogenase [Candidatus Bathyarchaeota archaeon B24-2]